MIKVGSCEEQSSGIYYWIFALAFLKYLSENNEKVGQVHTSVSRKVSKKAFQYLIFKIMNFQKNSKIVNLNFHAKN